MSIDKQMEALAAKIRSWPDEPFVSLTPMRKADVLKFADSLDDLRAEIAREEASASLPEPGVVSEDAVWMFKSGGKWYQFVDDTHRENTIADGRWEVSQFVPANLTPPTAPEATPSDHFVDANKKEAAPAGEVASDGSLTYDGQRKVVEHMTAEIRDAIALLLRIQRRAEAIDCQPQPAPAAQGGVLSLGQRAVAAELLKCFEAWEPGVRVLGNVQAKDGADLMRAVLAGAAQQPVAVDGASGGDE